jgi:Ca2+/H+ antiporter, TMEM165/GDT1 family
MDYSVLAAAGAAFLATLVEAVEALTIVLAVGTVRGWRPALGGAVAALFALLAMVAMFGPLLHLIPEHLLQLLIGVLLILFGGNWLRKAVLRAAGRKALHDEDATFAAETTELREQERRRDVRLQWLAATASFKAVFLEGVEIVFIVLALSTRPELLIPTSAAAVAATVLVAALGLLIHRPLSRVPENTLKFAVGVSLLTFGIFWTGEGLGFSWPGGDLAILGLLAGTVAVAFAAVAVLRR